MRQIVEVSGVCGLKKGGVLPVDGVFRNHVCWVQRLCAFTTVLHMPKQISGGLGALFHTLLAGTLVLVTAST